MKSFLKNLFFLLVVLVLGYVFRAPLLNTYKYAYNSFFPCTKPIAYSIGDFDTEFNLSEADFLKAITLAEAVWEKVAGRELFVHEVDGSLKMNLVYDYRQEATQKLRTLGIAVDDTRSSYDALKIRYDALVLDYNAQKKSVEMLVVTFEKDKKAYEERVAYWNAQGGAPKKEYEQLQVQKEALNVEMATIKRIQDSLNGKVDEINSLITVLNRLARSLNLNIEQYNQVGQSTGDEFDEGVYHSGPEGQDITIYQFDSKSKLTRVLAHELGHALGLEHIEDSKAIMYRLNQGSTLTPSKDDIVELKKVCKIK